MDSVEGAVVREVKEKGGEGKGALSMAFGVGGLGEHGEETAGERF